MFYFLAVASCFLRCVMTSFGNRYAKTFWSPELNVSLKSNICNREDEKWKADSTNAIEEKSIQKYEYWQKKNFRIISKPECL